MGCYYVTASRRAHARGGSFAFLRRMKPTWITEDDLFSVGPRWCAKNSPGSFLSAQPQWQWWRERERDLKSQCLQIFHQYFYVKSHLSPQRYVSSWSKWWRPRLIEKRSVSRGSGCTICTIRFCKSARRRQRKQGRKSKLYVSLLDYTHGRGIRTSCWRRYEAHDNKSRSSQAADW